MGLLIHFIIHFLFVALILALIYMPMCVCVAVVFFLYANFREILIINFLLKIILCIVD